MNKEMQSFNKNHAFHLESLGIHYVQKCSDFSEFAGIRISTGLFILSVLAAISTTPFPCWFEKFLRRLINISDKTYNPC